jgi:L-ascorbate metabolism protein UlaG (beta-lactamase superfamily)
MDAREAAAFVNAIRPRIAVPVHYGAVVGKPADADTFEKNVMKNIPVCRKLFF